MCKIVRKGVADNNRLHTEIVCPLETRTRIHPRVLKVASKLHFARLFMFLSDGRRNLSFFCHISITFLTYFLKHMKWS